VSILRRVRSIVSLSAVWGIVWSLCGLVFLHGHLRGIPISHSVFLISRWGLAGAGTAATFGALLIAFEPRRQSSRRFGVAAAAIYGAVAGSGFAAIAIGEFLVHNGLPLSQMTDSVFLSALLGAGSAALTLAIAQRGVGAVAQEDPDLHAPAT
jgi:hypothetical protein